MLMMALTMPGAAHAIGLGDIHVDSALNERLAAEIDIVGATADELIDLRASVANREAFLHLGADRPAFLSSATFKVAQDSQGRPVLAVRSTEAFTEPLVNFLVDLRWHKGEIVRQYTLLLDPPGFAAKVASAPAPPTAPDMPAAPPVVTPLVETKSQTMARRIDPPSDQPQSKNSERAARKTTHVKVGAKATLRGIAWRVGERSESGLQRMMIAIFRANPGAFDGNINRMHLGAVLTIPSYDEVESLSKSEAKLEVRAQMAAWHSPSRTVIAKAPLVASAAATTQSLNSQARNLEQQLAAAKAELAGMDGKIAELRQQTEPLQQADTEQTAAPQPTAQPPAETQQESDIERQSVAPPPVLSPVQPAPVAEVKAPVVKSDQIPFIPLIAGVGFLAAALGAVYTRLRRRSPSWKETMRNRAAMPDESMVETQIDIPSDWLIEKSGDSPPSTAPVSSSVAAASAPQSSTSGVLDDSTQPAVPAITVPKRISPAAAVISRAETDDATVNVRGADTANHRADAARGVDVTRIEPSRLDYNLADLDMTVQHVQMPSVLNEQTVMKERRTNLADVLKQAIEREPDRHDLRMKLLELYYSAASTNRQAFLDVVQKFAHEREHLPSDQWDKISFMGRQIFSENPLFAEEAAAADDELADCA
jgi:pilus assembly protein FimV